MIAGTVYLLDSLDVQLEAWCREHEQPAYRIGQIRRWLFEKRAASWEEMTDLPKNLRDALAASIALWSSRVVRHTKADDGTEKLLLALARGGEIECVLLPDGPRRAICISTQVGCGMGCVFCASGLDGIDRNLTAGEIVEQMLRLQHLLGPEERLGHIVVMGMGVTLANLGALVPALA